MKSTDTITHLQSTSNPSQVIARLSDQVGSSSYSLLLVKKTSGDVAAIPSQNSGLRDISLADVPWLEEAVLNDAFSEGYQALPAALRAFSTQVKTVVPEQKAPAIIKTEAAYVKDAQFRAGRSSITSTIQEIMTTSGREGPRRSQTTNALNVAANKFVKDNSIDMSKPFTKKTREALMVVLEEALTQDLDQPADKRFYR